MTACTSSSSAQTGGGNETAASSDELFLPNSTPESQGIDSQIFDVISQDAQNGRFGDLDSLVVIRNDHIIHEEYFREHGRDIPHRLYSVSKSITSLLIGIAMQHGFIEGLDQKLLDFFPEYELSEIANWDDRKADITLEDVLTMRAGFKWDEWSFPYTHDNNDTTPLFVSDDWMKHMLDLEMAHTPGSTYTYNSGVTMLLSGIIRNSSGMNTRDFALKYLYEPLGINNIDWALGNPGMEDTDPFVLDTSVAREQILYNTGWGMLLRSIDMAKIGYLVLNSGLWEEERLISEDWINISTAHHVNRGSNSGYGFQWWMRPMRNVTGHTPQINDIISANGWGGQFIQIIPSMNMIIVMNAENYTNGQAGTETNDLMPRILRAVRDVNEVSLN